MPGRGPRNVGPSWTYYLGELSLGGATPMESVAPAAIARPRVEAAAAALPWYLTAMLAGSTSIVVGLLWDISWHMTIGRDTFWTPAHMAIYLGGVVAGLSCGALALK